MTTRVAAIAAQIQALAPEERNEFLSWLVDFESQQLDAWDQQLERDSQPGGALTKLLEKVSQDILAGKTKPLDEIIDHS